MIYLAGSLASRVEERKIAGVVLGYHIVFTAYGFWLPNDPRGSWSTFVGAWDLVRAGGKATKTQQRRSLAHDEHDHRRRLKAKAALRHKPVEFSGPQAVVVAKGFVSAIKEANYVVHACSILPSHVHLVLGRTNRDIKRIVGHLKSKASHQLRISKLHPFELKAIGSGAVPSCWADGCWKVFLNSAGAIERAIEYVEMNPVKEGKPRQRWSIVVPFRE